jgi:DNA-binding MarR family transcriptional regulator
MTEVAGDQDVTHAEFADALKGLFRAARRARGRARSSGDSLTLNQLQLLDGFSDTSEELTVTKLSEVAQLSSPTVTRMLDCLERDGYVERKHSAKDRRAVMVTLTDGGKRQLQDKRAEFDAALLQVSESLSLSERRQAEGLLRRLADLIDEL